MWKCPACGTENRDDRSHCWKCSTSKGTRRSEAGQQKKTEQDKEAQAPVLTASSETQKKLIHSNRLVTNAPPGPDRKALRNKAVAAAGAEIIALIVDHYIEIFPHSEIVSLLIFAAFLVVLIAGSNTSTDTAEKAATEKDIIIREAAKEAAAKKGATQRNTTETVATENDAAGSYTAERVATGQNMALSNIAETLDQRNRRVMLSHVENFWVKGVFAKSLHGAGLFEVGIKKELKGETLPAGKSMLEIFQEVGMGCSLLILGAPGAGKTTMLLELTRQLIERARNDKDEPIPFVFNLASWTENQSLADWLAEQLNTVYYVPKRNIDWLLKNKKWVTQLLLDGFDEVKAESRVKCIEAINLFRKEHDLIPMVVCSRVEEYSVIQPQLSLAGTITIQPLTSVQVNAYLRRFDKGLAAVRQLLKKDKALRELAKTPLMLSIMTLAYKDRKADELIAPGKPEEQRKHLFDAYIARMFERSTRTTNTAFSKPQTLHYLRWLARTMLRHNIVTWQVESLQPSLFEKQSQRRLYRLYTSLLAGLMGGLIGWALGGLIGGLMLGLASGSIGGLMLGLAGGLITGLRNRISMTDRLEASSVVGIIGVLGQGLPTIILLVFIGVMTCGLILELIIWLIVEEIEWPIGVPIGVLGVGLIGGLGIWLIVAVIRRMNDKLKDWLTSLTSEKVEETSEPGQRLMQPLYNALFFTVTGMLFCGIIWLIGMFFERNFGMIFSVPILIGLMSGLFTPIQHYILQLMLTRRKLLPWRLVPFLDYAADLAFLRRVGGSYIFVHRLLMEHFAEMEV